jgi:hypothetical protein
MAFAFNPFTGNFDLKGSGGGSAFFAGEVATYADLPLDGTAALNSRWLVRNSSGTWPFPNYRQGGIYIRTSIVGSSRDNDYTLADTKLPDVFADSAFLLYDNSDSTRNLQFDLGNITTGTTRTLTVPNASGRIQIEGQPIGNTTPATGTFTTLTANNGTVTTNNPALSVSQTWNGAGQTFVAAEIVITRVAQSTNSAAFRVRDSGGANYLNVDLFGQTTLGFTRCNGLALTNNSVVQLFSGGSNILEQVAGTNAQTFNIYNTYTSATNHERGFLKWSSNVFQIGTEKGSGGGTARALEFQTDGVTRLTIASTGAATFAGGLSSVGINASGGTISTNQTLSLSATNMSCSAIFGTLDITTNAAGLRLYGLGNTSNSATNTERLHISTRTGNSYFISTQATGTGTARALEIRTADVARLTFEAAGGLTIADANDIAVGTTTGTKIGTGTTQKLGFFNATPVVQQAAVADATDAASTQARLNDLLGRLRTLGLIAT